MKKRAGEGLKENDLPPITDLSYLGRMEKTIERRGRRTSWIGDPAVSVLDAIHGRSIDKMATLDQVDEMPDEMFEGIRSVADPSTGNCAPFSSPYRLKFRFGHWRKVTLRAYALLERLSAVRAAQRRPPFKGATMERAARLIGEYHVWKHTPRIERDSEWPRSKDAFCSGYGVTTEQLDQALYLVRYKRWESRYLELENPEVVKARNRDVLNELAEAQRYAEKPDAGILKTALMVDGTLKQPGGVTINTGPKVNVHLPEGDMEARRARLLAEAERLKAREVPYREVESTQVPQGTRVLPRAEDQGAPGERQSPDVRDRG